MKTFFSILSFLLLMLAVMPASALDKQGRYLILGPGSTPCAHVLSDLAEGVKRNSQAAIVVYSNWLAGSLTGYNRDTKNTYSILGDTSFTESFQWTLNFCKDHPESIYSAAVDALILDFREDRLSAMPEEKSPSADAMPQE